MFSTLCSVTADTRQMAKRLKPLKGVGGAPYYKFDFNVVLLFGLTELKAQISWMEDVSLIFIVPYFAYCVDHSHTRAKKRGNIQVPHAHPQY